MLVEYADGWLHSGYHIELTLNLTLTLNPYPNPNPNPNPNQAGSTRATI